jgi:putative transposase
MRRKLHVLIQFEVCDRHNQNRTHLALEKDSPEPRPVQPPKSGRIVSIPVLGGLHHRYERRAA